MTMVVALTTDTAIGAAVRLAHPRVTLVPLADSLEIIPLEAALGILQKARQLTCTNLYVFSVSITSPLEVIDHRKPHVANVFTDINGHLQLVPFEEDDDPSEPAPRCRRQFTLRR
ncbi:hypothetical protein [Paraburkholderia strydomiana]|uniref:hypothetical protein n=1 Tax=Paraburkholderia strydomiana TaxID=1245417 RepID=UPI002855DE2A|nr:hypothetical protein [Paraburkholderia strydomiana]MDR7006195.1 hypothetical protein [Paraburkholderia strydomiana]